MMKIYLLFIAVALKASLVFSQNVNEAKTIHVFVSLCDNENQGIVPVPKLIGNGKDPGNNLYWGALYGVKNFLKNKSSTWLYLKKIESEKQEILERILFKHKTKNIFLLAEAYSGEEIKTCTENFLLASNGNFKTDIVHDKQKIKFGGASNLVAYIGHNGLMEFNVNIDYQEINTRTVDAIILACASKSYFKPELLRSKANPILWTTNLMAPEAYTLEAALNAWSENKEPEIIKEKAAEAYNKYQKCGIKGARRLLTFGM